MSDRILQIIQAPPGMKAVYRSGTGEMINSPVICLALVETSNGARYIQAIDFDKDGYFEDPCESENFLCYTLKNNEWRS